MFHVKHIHALFHVKQNVPAKTGQQTAHPRKQIKTAPSRRNSTAQSPLSGRCAGRFCPFRAWRRPSFFFPSACLGQAHTFFFTAFLFPVQGSLSVFCARLIFQSISQQNSDIPVHFPKMGFVWGRDERDETGGANRSAKPQRPRPFWARRDQCPFAGPHRSPVRKEDRKRMLKPFLKKYGWKY
ncbi:MAG: hypothetical protein IJC54_04110, partial [Clostridia bacterium]|nr:hypothetical protein [Clostridia bacterium]